MNKKYFLIFLISLVSLVGFCLEPILPVSFNFTNKPLIEIINLLADLKNINIILPQGVNAIKIDQTITYKPINDDNISLLEAWNLLKTFLELSGYSIIEKENIFTIVKNDEKIVKEILPLYYNINPNNLPNSEERVRYVYFLKNLKLSDDSISKFLEMILKDSLSQSQSVLTDNKANCLIITDKANLISSAMFIIQELDITGIKEAIEIIPLKYISATYAKKILDDIKQAITSDNKSTQFILEDNKSENSIIFPSGTVIQVDSNTNRLILMGKPTAIEAVKKLIFNQIDKKLESDESPIYIYDDLKYLNAEQCTKLLQAIVTGQTADGQSSGQAQSGATRRFGQMIIKSEPVVSTQQPPPSELGQVTIEDFKGLAGTSYSGGNRILIAGSKRDRTRVINLIKELDTPEPQVVIETLIIDLISIKTNSLAVTNRNRIKCPGDNGFDYLAFNGIYPAPNLNTTGGTPAGSTATTASGGVLPQPATTLASDLLYVISNSTATGPCAAVQPGSLLFSLNDNSPYSSGVSAILQILDTKFNTKIITQPTVVSTSGQISTIKQEIIRRQPGDPYTSGGGVPTIPIIDIKATIGLQTLPRIATSQRVAIEIGLTINSFVTSSSSSSTAANGNRLTRKLNTNVNMNSGQILILGGLKKTTDSNNEYDTPLLSRIPLVGWFWKNKTKQIENDNILVFIIPTIIMPQKRSESVDSYTHRKLRDTAEYTVDRGIDQDPIDKTFFKGTDIEKIIIDNLAN